MSKQSDAKKDQNYRKTPNICANCEHYSSQLIEKTYDNWDGPYTYSQEKNLRCKLGGFAISRGATCDRHILSENAR